jgi:hypothetical protein
MTPEWIEFGRGLPMAVRLVHLVLRASVRHGYCDCFSRGCWRVRENLNLRQNVGDDCSWDPGFSDHRCDSVDGTDVPSAGVPQNQLRTDWLC